MIPQLPPRRTCTSGTASCLSATIARSARSYCRKPGMANSSTTAEIAAVSSGLPRQPDSAAAAIGISAIVLMNGCHRINRGGGRGVARIVKAERNYSSDFKPV